MKAELQRLWDSFWGLSDSEHFTDLRPDEHEEEKTWGVSTLEKIRLDLAMYWLTSFMFIAVVTSPLILEYVFEDTSAAVASAIVFLLGLLFLPRRFAKSVRKKWQERYWHEKAKQHLSYRCIDRFSHNFNDIKDPKSPCKWCGKTVVEVMAEISENP